MAPNQKEDDYNGNDCQQHPVSLGGFLAFLLFPLFWARFNAKFFGILASDVVASVLIAIAV
jgi:hypothetical protein